MGGQWVRISILRYARGKGALTDQNINSMNKQRNYLKLLTLKRFVECRTDMGEEDRGGLPDLDLDPTRFLSRYYPPRDISPMAGV